MTFSKLALATAVLSLAACGGSKNSNNNSSNNGNSNSSNPSANCQSDIDNGKVQGITALPENAGQQYKQHFCKYTKLSAPNGKPIHFYAQNKISNEQMVRARNILKFYLTDVPGSEYGADKSAVWNQMANNQATLIMFNGSDGDIEVPEINGQTLFETENVVEGSAAYLVNEPRDAAFEEILHLMHDTGIGVDFSGAMKGVLPAYQAEIRAATNNAAPSSLVAGGKGIWASGSMFNSWLAELKTEGSLTQEYLAAVIDGYYGLAGKSSAEGFNDIYAPQTRAEIKTKDPMGWALMGEGNNRKYFSEYVTYTGRIDPSYEGTFTLTFDANTKYTYKSQYLLDATLLGGKNTNLIGNDQNNHLTGNAGDNVLTGKSGNDVIDGGEGSDTAVFTGAASEYTVTTSGSDIVVADTVADRDGTDTLKNIELIQYSDAAVTP